MTAFINLVSIYEKSRKEIVETIRNAPITKRDCSILLDRYARRQTYEAIGKEWLITMDRVRQIESNAIQKIVEWKKGAYFSVKQRDGYVAFFSQRTQNALVNGGIFTVEDAVKKINLKTKWCNVRGCGKECVNEILKIAKEEKII